MLDLKNSNEVIAAITAHFQIVSGCSEHDADRYRDMLQNLVKIVRCEQTIATNNDMRKVDEIAQRSKTP